jgi:hypothetical protein
MIDCSSPSPLHIRDRCQSGPCSRRAGRSRRPATKPTEPRSSRRSLTMRARSSVMAYNPQAARQSALRPAKRAQLVFRSAFRFGRDCQIEEHARPFRKKITGWQPLDDEPHHSASGGVGRSGGRGAARVVPVAALRPHRQLQRVEIFVDDGLFEKPVLQRVHKGSCDLSQRRGHARMIASVLR